MDYIKQKQTAVEWLEVEIDNKDMGEIPMWIYEFIQQAKEMEKEQIMESYKDSTCQFSVDSRIDCPKSAEQYYNETFNK